MRLYALTRLWVLLTVVGVRLSPLFGLLLRSRVADVTPAQWAVGLAATVLLQVAFYMVERRCSGSQLTHWRGLMTVGAAMSTGWTYLDLVFVSCGVLLALVASSIAALLPHSQQRDEWLIRWFFRYRMEQ